MIPIFSYMIKSTGILLVLLIYYQLFLKKQTFFNLNRIYLLGALILASVLPFISIEISGFSGEEKVTGQNLILYLSNLLEEVSIVANNGTKASPVFPSPLSFIGWIYGVGVLFFLMRYLFSFIRLGLLIHHHPKKHLKRLHLVFLNPGQPTFSFFNYLFICPTSLSRENKRKIFAHEKIHICQGHSLDLILAELVCITNWFNPLVWILKNAILENHEYIADHQVIRRFHTGSYLELLIQQTFKGAYSFTNYFSCSNLKKRTIMMTKKQSHKCRVINYIPALALTGMLFYLFSCNSKPESSKLPAESVTTQAAATENVITETPATANVTTAPAKENEEDVFVVVENMPTFDGNVHQWLSQHLKYPAEAVEKNIQGKVYIQFIIEKDGSVSNAKVVRGAHELLDKEALKVVSEMPKWTPGKQREKAVRVSYTLPISFSLSDDKQAGTK